MFSLSNKLFKLENNLRRIPAVRWYLNLEVEDTKSLKERLKELNPVDEELSYKVDIGLPPPQDITNKEMRQRQKYLKQIKNDWSLEKKSRNLTLEVDLADVRKEWLKSHAPLHVKVAAEHYNVFDDLFGDAYFTPYVNLDIYYPLRDRDLVVPVYRGNVVKPEEAFLQPVVGFESDPDTLWTLVLVNPDGHLTEENMEYVHWFVGNIPGNDVSKGEVIWDYLPPFPPRGVGFQRLIFVLYKQDEKMDYSKLKQKIPCLELKNRSFKTLEFYRERQDFLTPCGLAFFQSDWDKTSRSIYHEVLNMEEPVFEYDYPPKVYKKQVWFPKKQAFDKYLDRYRDPRDIAQEYILKKLKEIDPLSPPKKPFPFPKVVNLDERKMPTWLRTKETNYKLNRGRVTEIARDDYE